MLHLSSLVSIDAISEKQNPHPVVHAYFSSRMALCPIGGETLPCDRLPTDSVKTVGSLLALYPP